MVRSFKSGTMQHEKKGEPSWPSFYNGAETRAIDIPLFGRWALPASFRFCEWVTGKSFLPKRESPSADAQNDHHVLGWAAHTNGSAGATGRAPFVARRAGKIKRSVNSARHVLGLFVARHALVCCWSKPGTWWRSWFILGRWYMVLLFWKIH